MFLTDLLERVERFQLFRSLLGSLLSEMLSRDQVSSTAQSCQGFLLFHGSLQRAQLFERTALLLAQLGFAQRSQRFSLFFGLLHLAQLGQRIGGFGCLDSSLHAQKFGEVVHFAGVFGVHHSRVLYRVVVFSFGRRQQR